MGARGRRRGARGEMIRWTGALRPAGWSVRSFLLSGNAGNDVTEDDVKRVSGLAMLKQDEIDMQKVSADMSKILHLFRTIEQVDTSGLAPMISPITHNVSLRPDIPFENDEQEATFIAATSNSHTLDGRFF